MIATFVLALSLENTLHREMLAMHNRILKAEERIVRLGGGTRSPLWQTTDFETTPNGAILEVRRDGRWRPSLGLYYTKSMLAGLPSEGRMKLWMLGNTSPSFQYGDKEQMEFAMIAWNQHRETTRTILIEEMVAIAQEQGLQFDEVIYSFDRTLEEASEAKGGETATIRFRLRGIPSGHLHVMAVGHGMIDFQLIPGVLSDVRHDARITETQALEIAQARRPSGQVRGGFDYETASLTYYNEDDGDFPTRYFRQSSIPPLYRYEAYPLYAVRGYKWTGGRWWMARVDYVDAVTGEYFGGELNLRFGSEPPAQLMISVNATRYDLIKGVPPVEPETTKRVLKLFGQRDTEASVSTDGRWVKVDFGWYQSTPPIKV